MTDLLAEFKHAAILNSLQKCALFTGIADEDLAAVAAITVRKFPQKGEYLFHEGAPSQGIYLVEQGAIKLNRISRLGKERVLHVFRAHESFAEETLGPDLGHPTDASAVEDSQVLLVHRAEFLSLIKRRPDLALRVLRSMNEQLCLLMGLLGDLAFKDVKTRVGDWLIQHCPNPNSREPYRFQLPMAKRMLASELGAMSETLSRTFAKFRDQKLIAVEGKTVTLLCPAKLTQFLRQSLGAVPA